ncbi:MAG: hypothetical protein AAGJ93_11775 [Bacteroidota bacterium]
MKVSRQRIAQVALFLASSAFLSSCNRGYGCPTDFSIDEVAINLINTVVTVLF